MKRISNSLTALVCVLMLALPAAAFAQSGIDGYEGEGSDVQALVDDGAGNDGAGTEPTSAAANDGSLPFTGSELGVLAGAGGLLVLLGFGLRRITHRPHEA